MSYQGGTPPGRNTSCGPNRSAALAVARRRDTAGTGMPFRPFTTELEDSRALM